jgi:hypothetical protein
MIPAPIAAPRGRTTFAVESTDPRGAAMAYAKRLVREQGVRLRHVNYRRGPDGVLMVSAPGCLTIRFTTPEVDEV